MTFLVVESPAKAKKIQTFFKDNKTIVKSSFGHICNLDTKKLDEMLDNGFTPIYINDPKKRDVIKTLKSIKDKDILLAADDDREGDAIAWHTGNLFKLDYSQCNRIKFNEISKKAILNAIKNPTKLDMDSVNAQRARQLIDLMIGYKLSPLLWKNVKTDKMGLSAGRVQSCLLNMLNNKHLDIEKYLKNPKYSRILTGSFTDDIEADFKFIDKNITNENVKEILDSFIKDKQFLIENNVKKEEKVYPNSPLITSTLQQAAQKELGFPVKMTMNIAQKLYDNGKITYMRTDSTFISDDWKVTLKDKIDRDFGTDYYNNRKSKKVKGAQEAHEAIRPTDINVSLSDKYEDVDIKLYELIKKKTILSHMKPAIYDTLTLTIGNNNINKYGNYETKIKSLKFDGYLKYSNPDKEVIDLKKYEKLTKINLLTAKFKSKETEPPSLYNESSIVKKLETSGVGRPSTYATLVDTLYKRTYTELNNTKEIEKVCNIIQLTENNEITEYEEEYKVPPQKNKIVVTELGKLVLDYLKIHFQNILDEGYTSKVETDLDLISQGKIEWQTVIKKVYDSIMPIVIRELGPIKSSKGNTLFTHKKKDITLHKGNYGDYIKYNGKNHSIGSYLSYKKIKKEDLQLEDCLEIIQYPKVMGKHDNKPIEIIIGKFGYCLRYDKKFKKISQDKSLWTKEYCIRLVS